MNHQYIKITDIDKPLQGTMRGIPGAIVVCAVCGEVKNVWSDGVMEVVKEGNKKLHGPARTHN